MRITTPSVEKTLALGRLIGRLAPVPPALTCIALDGPLGAGKTHLTRGIAEGAAVFDPSLVSSPTYVLLNIYPGPKPVYHLDAYRLRGSADLAALGFEELLAAGGIVVVEWAARVGELLPSDCLRIEIEHAEETDGRSFRFESTGVVSGNVLKVMSTQWHDEIV